MDPSKESDFRGKFGGKIVSTVYIVYIVYIQYAPKLHLRKRSSRGFLFSKNTTSFYLPRHTLFCLVPYLSILLFSGISFSSDLDPMHLTVLNLTVLFKHILFKIRHTIPFGLSQGPHSPDRFLITSSLVRLPVQLLVAAHNLLHRVGFAST